ncbi:MAG TPA: AMP-binding protein [Candidatus Acidoferrales bacterium]|nr:AMP-binding protein [Candidatus Acidoferrales bacterium]
MPRKSLAEFVCDLERRGNAPAWAHHRGYRTERWSYRRTALVARQFARELEARGVGRGERVLIWGENCAEWVAAFLGCILRGAVAVPMDRIAAREFALRIARDTQARLIVAGRELAATTERDAGLKADSTLILEDLAQSLAHHADASYEPPPLARSDLAQLVFTSGTTAEPKGVAISHGNLLANLEPLEAAIHPYLKYEWLAHPLRFLDLLPLSHVFGQFMGIWVPPLLGGTVFFHDTLNPADVTHLIRRERISVLIAVPRMLESLRARVEREEEAAGRGAQFRRDFAWAAKDIHFARRWWRFHRVHDEFGWKFWAFICGGAALDAETEEFWRRLSFVVIQGYGLTETTSLISVNHPFQLSRGSIGKVLPGRELRLSDTGEILVRGENVAAGYWEGGAFQPAAESGWFHTGDVGALDVSGNLFFKGRQKNVIVTPEGMNVYPEDLEAALRAQSEVRDCVVVALPREKNAEACAVLLLRHDTGERAAPREGAGASPGSFAAAAVRRANERLGAHQQIRHWRIWPDEDFPRTSTQKPRTNVILECVQAQDRAAEGRAPGPGPSPQAGPLAELVARVTGRAPQALAPDATLDRDLGLNSLERVELISAIEDRYQTELSESSVSDAATVADLGRLLEQKPGAGPAYVYPAWTQQGWQQAIRVVIYYLFVWPATNLLAHPRVRGRENLSALARGPVLVISNHITEIDIGFILAALPARRRHRLAVAMIGERLRDMRNPPPGTGLFRRWLDRLEYFLIVALFNVFPLPQRSGYRESFAYAGASADRGYSVLVFPEGRRTPDGQLGPFRAGIGLLAKRLDLPVVPMRIDGLFELARAQRRTAPPGAVRVSIGAPIQFAPGDTEESIVARLQLAVADLEWRAEAPHAK